MKSLLVIFSLALLATGCLKSTNGSVCTDVSPATEEPTIQAYCTANFINATKDSSGLYYQIISPGTAPMPDLNDSVYVNYTGKYLTGTVFDQSSAPIGFILGQLIPGWVIGLEKIGAGGQMKLVVPSSLAYGCQGYGPIQPNTVLYFDLMVTKLVQNP